VVELVEDRADVAGEVLDAVAVGFPSQRGEILLRERSFSDGRDFPEVR